MPGAAFEPRRAALMLEIASAGGRGGLSSAGAGSAAVRLKPLLAALPHAVSRAAAPDAFESDAAALRAGMGDRAFASARGDGTTTASGEVEMTCIAYGLAVVTIPSPHAMVRWYTVWKLLRSMHATR